MDDSVHRLDETAGFWRKVDEEIVVLMRDSTAYLAVNGSGAQLWDLLAAGATVSELAERLERSFGLSREQAVQDAGDFVEDLQAKGLVRPPA